MTVHSVVKTKAISAAMLIIVSTSLTCAAVADDSQPGYILVVPEATRMVLIAETATSTLYRFRYTNGRAVLQDKHYMSIGENGVGKERSWDRRTPLGVYFVSDQLDTTNLHKRYGVTAFPLDYPNGWDRRHGRSGDGIWLHGVNPDGGRRPALDTDGCLALPNDRLQLIAADIQPLSTPVVIAREIRWSSREELREVTQALEAALDAWTEALAAGDLHGYFRLYDEDFSYLGMDRNEWMAFRLQTIGDRVLDELVVSELNLFADPEEEELYVSRFRQTLVETGRRVTTTKRLYWRRKGDGSFLIVAEDNG